MDATTISKRKNAPRAGYKDEPRRVLDILASLKKPFLILFAILLCGAAPLLFADVVYIDDAYRVIHGSGNWITGSRYLTELLAPIVHTGSFLADISPLSQIIAIAALALAGVVLLKALTTDDSWTIWQYAALVPFFLSPYYLQCLSYKYDAPYMAASILFSVLPLLTFNKASRLSQIVVVFVCTIAMCSTYQASSGILPMLVAFWCFITWISQQREKGNADIKQIALSCLTALLSYGAALLFYQKVMVKAVADYASSSLPALSQIAPTYLSNISSFYSAILADFKPLWLFLIALVLIGFFVAAVISCRKHPLLAFLFAFAVLLFCALVCFGAYLVLESVRLHPRALYGFGAFLSLVCLFVASCKSLLPFKVSVLLLAWCFVVYSFIYANALQQQDEWADYRTREVVDGLASTGILQDGQTYRIQVVGSIGRAPSLDEYYADYPILTRMIPPLFAGDTYAGVQKLIYGYGLPLSQGPYSSSEDWRELPVIESTFYHTIKAEDDRIRVELSE